MPSESKDDDPPLSLATFDQLAEELERRSTGYVIACLIRQTNTEEHVYATWSGRTIALGLCERIKHRILNTQSPQIPEDH